MTYGTLLENGCWQILSTMANFASLVCIQMEIEGIEVCHFHWELFLDLNSLTKQVGCYTIDLASGIGSKREKRKYTLKAFKPPKINQD